MGILSNITTSTLTHHSVSSSNIISNNSSPLLADIVHFGLLCIEVSTPYKECSFPFPIDVGSHNSPPWEPTFSSAYHLVSDFDTICPLWHVTYRHQSHNCKTHLVGRGFHSLIRNVLFLSSTDVGFHNSPSSEPAFSPAYHSVSDSDTICPLWLVTYHGQPHGFKTCLLERGFHSLVSNVLFLSPTDVGSHNLYPIGGSAYSVSGSIPFVTTYAHH